MQLFSRGSFYLGKDDESFFDVSIHLGKYRLEWGGHRKPQNESFKETSN